MLGMPLYMVKLEKRFLSLLDMNLEKKLKERE